MKLLQEWNTPLAPGACSQTFRKLRWNSRFLSRKIRTELAKRDVEAEADVIIWFHVGRVPIPARRLSDELPGESPLCE